MTPDLAAARCGLTPRDVLGVREHPVGHLVDLRRGGTWLVTDTVARPYVPDVDDQPAAEPAGRVRPASEPAGEPAGEDSPSRTRRRKA